MKQSVLFLLLMMCSFVRADATPLTLDECLVRSQHVVDATIESFTNEGFANLKVNTVLMGENAPIVAKWVHQCAVSTMREYGKVGSRWILCLAGKGESVLGLYEIRIADNGVAEFKSYDAKWQIVWTPFDAITKKLVMLSPQK